MRRLFLTLAFVLAPRAALAADECNASYEQADLTLHASTSTHDLLDARDKLRTCSRRECKAWMVKDCVKWLDEVEARISSVVVVARDANGADVTDTEVTLDGKTIRTDGHAVETNPGEHTFVVTFADGKQATQKMLVREGEKAQHVTVALAKASPPPPAKPAAPKAAVSPVLHTEPAKVDLRTISIVTAGAGLAGIALGSFFGVKAMGDKSDAECDDGRCDAGHLSDARSAATVSTVGFVAGGVLLAGGAALFFFDMKKNGTRVGGAW